MVARTERRLNRLTDAAPRSGGEAAALVSDRARELHATLEIVDLHADTFLWSRDILLRADRGHVDVPRMVEGNLALQVFAATTQSPRHLDLERNDDRTDDVTLVAIASGWPTATWRSRLARALALAARAQATADRSGGRFTLLRGATDLAAFRSRRAGDRSLAAGFLAIEGAHALDGDPANVDVVADAGFRMMAPTHFFDNAFGGSAHGVDKGGLTPKGREMVARMESRRMLVDVAHASSDTIDDVLSIATRPVVDSHTGVRGVADNTRNLPDDQLRGIAATGGLIGIGFWETACGGPDAASIARSIAYAVGVVGADHVALGSDFDGAVATPFDASGLVLLTDALIGVGLADDDIAAVMGGNAMRLLAATLPV